MVPTCINDFCLIFRLTGVGPAVGLVGGARGRARRRAARGARGARRHLVRHVHLYGVARDALVVGERVGARLAAREVALHPLEHGQHGVGRRQAALGRRLRYVGRRYAEGCRHAFERLWTGWAG